MLDGLAARDQIPDLAGVSVYAVGAGVVAGPELSGDRILAIERFWQGFFERSGSGWNSERYGAAWCASPERARDGGVAGPALGRTRARVAGVAARAARRLPHAARGDAERRVAGPRGGPSPVSCPPRHARAFGLVLVRPVRGHEPGGARGIAGLHRRDVGGRRGRDVGDRGRARAWRAGGDLVPGPPEAGVRAVPRRRARRDRAHLRGRDDAAGRGVPASRVRRVRPRASASAVQAELLSTYAVDLLPLERVSGSLRVRGSRGIPIRRTSWSCS